jgi:hypothetical protein
LFVNECLEFFGHTQGCGLPRHSAGTLVSRHPIRRRR